MGLLSDERYRALAKDQWHRDGEVEIDEEAVVSNGDDRGAYVQAWVWVDDPESDHDHPEPIDPAEVNDHLRNEHEWDLTYSQGEAVQVHDDLHAQED